MLDYMMVDKFMFNKFMYINLMKKEKKGQRNHFIATLFIYILMCIRITEL